MDKNVVSPDIESCIGKCPGLRIIFFKTSKYYLQYYYAFSCSCFYFWDIILVDYVHLFMTKAQTVLFCALSKGHGMGLLQYPKCNNTP